MKPDEAIRLLPTCPGVYIMKGPREILYIGKAKNLRARVRSYFRGARDERHTTRYLASKVTSLDYIVTSNEKEALILEDTLLKKHKPRYNIRLKDDKTYVNIKLTIKERFPRILVTREIKGDGARYFGPYPSARGVRDTVKFIRTLFPLCVCSPHEFKTRRRPCLDYQMGICSAPAVGFIGEEEYGEMVEGATMFLEGKNREVVEMLKKKMVQLSDRQQYEEAAKVRDRIRSIEVMLEEQKMVEETGIDKDVFGFYDDKEGFLVEALFLRGGRLVGARDFPFPPVEMPIEEVFSSFLGQFYRGARLIPDEILVPVHMEDGDAFGEWLSEKKHSRVVLKTPLRGRGKKLIQMANENAVEAFKRLKAKETIPLCLEEIKERLRISKPPRAIEAFDISNISGDMAVGAMVVFKDGNPQKDLYRRYRIKLTFGPNDYAMMREVLMRRYKKGNLPDLILVDGGKGQLNIAATVLKEFGIKVPLAALAKEKGIKGERVYIEGVKDPIILKEGSKGDLFLRRIRDEAHRFAISYHRGLRKKKIASILENIAGIGKKRRRLLFERFGDIEGIRSAATEELGEIPGITEELAKAIKEGLK